MNMKHSNQGLSSKEEFKQFIESIGFEEIIGSYYRYKEFKIDLYKDQYCFHNGSEWCFYALNDLTLLEKYFKKELRSIKLKELLR